MLWGIDLGGTKIEGVAIQSSSSGTIVARERIDTEREKGYTHILDRVELLLNKISKQVGDAPKRLGIGTPGVVDPASLTLKNSNTQCLIGKPIKLDLESRLKIPIEIANDANCFALAEATFGAGKGAESVFGVILGTGVGGGIVLNGKTRYGAQGIAGEWGHNVLIEEGPSCYCGKAGCVESVIAGPSLEKYYYDLSGERKSLAEIAALDTKLSKQTVSRLCSMFGRAIAVVINILDPEVVVIGGGVSNIDALYSDGIEATKKYVFNNRLETKIVKHQLGDSAGVIGAALLT